MTLELYQTMGATFGFAGGIAGFTALGLVVASHFRWREKWRWARLQWMMWRVL
jgi:hypothetical protein